MLQHVERAERTAMEKKIFEQEGIIAHQERQLTALISKSADYERMKQALENAKNELAESKEMLAKYKAENDALKDRRSATAGPPKSLKHPIYVMDAWDSIKGTVVDFNALLPVTVARPFTLHYERRYKIVADDAIIAEFVVGPALSSSAKPHVLVAVDIGVSGALTGSVQYDNTKMEFKNTVRVV